jgi:hypothetical protein
MKKFLLITITVISGLAFAYPVSAATIECPTIPTLCSVSGILSTFSTLVAPIATIIFLFMIILGGYTKMTAAGNVEKEKRARQILEAAIIGFCIIVLAPLIVSLLLSLLGAKSVITSN